MSLLYVSSREILHLVSWASKMNGYDWKQISIFFSERGLPTNWSYNFPKLDSRKVSTINIGLALGQIKGGRGVRKGGGLTRSTGSIDPPPFFSGSCLHCLKCTLKTLRMVSPTFQLSKLFQGSIPRDPPRFSCLWGLQSFFIFYVVKCREQY